MSLVCMYFIGGFAVLILQYGVPVDRFYCRNRYGICIPDYHKAEIVIDCFYCRAVPSKFISKNNRARDYSITMHGVCFTTLVLVC